MHSSPRFRFTAIALFTLVAVACSSEEDDDATSAASGSASGTGAQSTGGGGDGGAGATGGSAQGGGGQSTGGTAGSGGTATGGAGGSGGGGGGEGGSSNVTGCATPDGMKCPGLETCCQGVPYPPEGICKDECNMKSDRFSKTAFESVDRSAVLAAIAAIEVSEWSYLEEGTEVRHLGPMAQDFHQAFGLGSSDERIHPVDASGVAIAAIQELEHRVRDLDAQNARLRNDNAQLARRLDRLERSASRR